MRGVVKVFLNTLGRPEPRSPVEGGKRELTNTGKLKAKLLYSMCYIQLMQDITHSIEHINAKAIAVQYTWSITRVASHMYGHTKIY